MQAASIKVTSDCEENKLEGDCECDATFPIKSKNCVNGMQRTKNAKGLLFVMLQRMSRRYYCQWVPNESAAALRDILLGGKFLKPGVTMYTDGAPVYSLIDGNI